MTPRLALALALLAACGPKPHDITTTFALSPQIPAGNVEVVLNGPTGALSVTVNDQLVVDRKVSRKAVINAVPAGFARVHVAVGGGCELGATFDRDIEVIAGATTTLALPGPEISTGCAVLNGLYHIGLNVGLVASAVVLAASVVATRR